MFELNRIYHRKRELHDIYGGNRQGGIASCGNHPYIFLFSAPTGEEFGYKDGWVSSNEYVYTGEGQYGDMSFVRGNRAIKDHLITGKQLHMFEQYKKGEYKYLGRFEYHSFEYQRGKDARGHDRQIIRFHLVPAKDK
jgi:5-methylcytosine-specific restriction protein A